MDSEFKQLLEANIKLSKENNRMLKKMRRAQKRATIFRVLYWIVIIAIALGAIYFLQPYFERVKTIYEQILPGLEGIGDIGNIFGQ